MTKTILAFGDSLTWGYHAGQSARHPFADRWPNALGAKLGGMAHVIAEGCNARTTAYDDHTDGAELNGAKALPMLLKTHEPLDLVIIMLGTNDLKFAARCRAFDSALGMNRLAEIIATFPFKPIGPRPQLLIMSPPPLCKTDNEWFNDLWGHAIAESKLFAKHYARVAEENGAHFFDAGSVAKADPTDGGHLDAANTRKLGEALAPVVKKILEI